tara:strand:- start:5581 stop:5811 length:231 start_codon:yes stop_codon:yes gene_type:complete
MTKLTTRQAEALVAADIGFIRDADLRVGAALERMGLTERYSYYEPKTYGDDLSVGLTIVQYSLTDEGERVRETLTA